MSYETIEVGAASVLAKVPGFSPGRVSRGDFRIFSKGHRKFILLMPGSIPRRMVVANTRRVSTVWIISVYLIFRFTSDINEIIADIKKTRSLVLDHMDKYPTLNRVENVVNAFITGGNEPSVWEDENYFAQIFTLEVTENKTAMIAE